MKIAVAGTGYVGLSLAVLLAQHNEVIVKDENKELSVFVNGKLSCKSDSFSSIPNLNLSGIQVGIGNKAITNAVYQALLVYNRALSEAEVQDLNVSLNVMYQ